jgi:hypothetical protein
LDYFPTKDLLPLFSQSKINECHADITFPTHYNQDQLLSEEDLGKLPPWEERKDTLFFRGSTTGTPFALLLIAIPGRYCSRGAETHGLQQDLQLQLPFL